MTTLKRIIFLNIVQTKMRNFNHLTRLLFELNKKNASGKVDYKEN